MKINGIEISTNVGFTAGESISERDLVYVNLAGGTDTAGRVYQADYDSISKSADAWIVGFATAAATAGNEVEIQTYGILDGFSSLVAGSVYYVSSTAGGITLDNSSEGGSTHDAWKRRAVGVAVSSTALLIDTVSRSAMEGATSGLGRGVFFGGISSGSTRRSAIDYITIATLHHSLQFGDLPQTRGHVAAVGNNTRAVAAAGVIAGSQTGNMQYVTFTTEADSADFGEMGSAHAAQGIAAAGSATRALFLGGYLGSSWINVISYAAFAIVGIQVTDFGDLTAPLVYMSAASSPTRVLTFGGQNTSSAAVNVIQYVTIATTGNATDFGDLNTSAWGVASVSSNTRAVTGGGWTGSAVQNVMDYVTIATTGNATDFGDLTLARSSAAGVSTHVRGVFIGGYINTSPNHTDTIDYITIATTGNATDFADVANLPRYHDDSGASDAGGGLA